MHWNFFCLDMFTHHTEMYEKKKLFHENKIPFTVLFMKFIITGDLMKCKTDTNTIK